MILLHDTRIFAKLWKKDIGEKSTLVRLGTSEKGQDGKYKNSNWYARAIGKAHETIADVPEGANIVITLAKFTNESFVNEDGHVKSLFNFTILEMEPYNQPTSEPRAKTVKKATSKPEPAKREDPWATTSEEGLPF